MSGNGAAALSTSGKLLICLAASLTPAITTLVRFQITSSPDLTAYMLIGYIIKEAAGFIACLIVVFVLFPDEADRRKIYAIALSAPAYLSASLPVTTVLTKSEAENHGTSSKAGLSIVSRSYAAEQGELGQWPDDSKLSQVIQGFVGAIPQRTYWVQLMSERSAAEAINDAATLQSVHSNLGYKFQAYPSYCKPGYYAVMMGGPFASRDGAQRAVEIAKRENLVTLPGQHPVPVLEPYVFSLPRSC